MVTDQSILGELDQQKYAVDTGLNDGIFGDIWDGIKEVGTDVWDGVKGNTKESATKAVSQKVDEVFGNEQVSYDQQNSQTYGPTLPQEQPPKEKESFVKKVHPAIVGAGATAVAKYGIKLGWVTSLAIGGAAGAAKHFLIDKKGAN